MISDIESMSQISAREALKFVRRILEEKTQKSLDTTQAIIFVALWNNSSIQYQVIAEQIGFSEQGIKESAARMYKLLNQAFPYSCKIKKTIFKDIIVSYYIKEQNFGNIEFDSDDSAIFHLEESLNDNGKTQMLNKLELEASDRPVPLKSKFYMTRENEGKLYRAILNPGAVIRIIGQRKSGATSLVSRLGHHASSNGDRLVLINFQGVESDALDSMKSFAKWFCFEVADQLEIDDALDEYWRESRPNASSQKYFEKCILPQLTTSVIIIFDRIDIVFNQVKTTPERLETARIFFALIRSWIDRQSTLDIWTKFKYIIVQSGEDIEMGSKRSPFNIGVSFTLSNFSTWQIIELAKKYRLNLSKIQIKQLSDLFGDNLGNPYLIRSIFNFIIEEDCTVEQFIQLDFHEIEPFKYYLKGSVV